MKYDLFFQNNGSKQIFSMTGIEPTEANAYYLTFEEFDIPEDMEDGEYTYVVFVNDLEDVTYEFSACLLDSFAITDGEKYEFRALKPLTGLLRIGQPKSDAIYSKSNNNENIYYRK